MPNYVTVDTEPERIRVNSDQIDNATIVRKETKTKYTHLTLETGSVVRVPRDQPVTVLRVEKTDEEKREERRVSAVQHLTRTVSQYIDVTPAKRVAEELDSFYRRRESNPYANDLFTWSNLSRVLESQARREVWVEVHRVLHHLEERGVHDVTVVTAAVSVMIECEKKLRRMKSPASRSTNGVSNMLEDFELWARAEFIDEMKLLIDDEMRAEEAAKVYGE